MGFLGCGNFASQAIWPSLRFAPIDVGYAFSRGMDKASSVGRMFGAERATASVEDVLDDDAITAVFVVGPPQVQFELALQAIEAGKHIFVEKPPAPTLDQTLELQRAASKADVQVQVAFQKRFALGYQLARERAAAEAFGGIRLLKINYSHWANPDWRTYLSVMSIHPIDLVRYFLGDPVEAWVLKRHDPEGRHTCVLTLLYSDGASAVVNMSASDPHVQEWVEISGANQLISVRNLVEMKQWGQASTSRESMQPNPVATSAWHPEFAIPYRQADSLWLQGYAGEVVAFADALMADRPVDPSIEDAVAAMGFVEAILEAPEGMSQLKVAV